MWLFRRDNSCVHNANYHGNFIPQVPRQLFSRYTKKGDWILDPFMGSGTALIEAQRMGRNSVGVDLQWDVIQEAESRIEKEQKLGVYAKGFCGDSVTANIENICERAKNKKVSVYHLSSTLLGYNKIFK